ncbi:MAG: hypothetical protein IEMM0008_1015 [bacterium]|nr:MAG: hypothetical protein IEMM0008_1015 [bacterium]
MGQYYQSNLKVIQKKGWDKLLQDPPGSIRPPSYSKSNLPILKYKNTYIHSPYDPIKEAERQVQLENREKATLILIFGLGYGYHILQLLNKLEDQPCIIIIFEYSEDIFNSSLHHADLQFLEDPRIILFVGEDFRDELHYIFASLKVSDIKGTHIQYLQSEYTIFKDQYNSMLQGVNSILQQQFQNQLTSLEFEKLWLKNLLRNSVLLSRHQDISALFNGFEGKTAIVVSAGPSLAVSIKELQRFREKVVIISTDTALNPLLEGDIIPDFVVAVDAQYHNFKDFLGLTQELSISLFYNLMVFPKIPRWVQGQHYYFSSCHMNKPDHPFVTWIAHQTGLRISSILSGSSVATTAIEIARRLGFKSILLIGQDLSYPNLMSHSVSSPIYDAYIYSSANRLNTLETLFYRLVHARKPFIASEKPILKTDFVFKNLLDWLGEYAALYQNEDATLLLNATHTGLAIPNIPNVLLKDYLSHHENLYGQDSKQYHMAKLKHSESLNPKVFNNLINCYETLYTALLRFLKLLLKELDRPAIEMNNVLLAKSNIEHEYSFLSFIYQKEDLWFFRKDLVKEEDQVIYANTLLKATESILISLKRLKSDLYNER